MTVAVKAYIALGIVLAIIGIATGAYLKGHSDGVDSERVDWQARENTELKAANNKILELEKRNREIEQDTRDKLSTITADLRKENSDEIIKKDSVINGLRSGAARLRVTCGKSTDRSPGATAPADPGGTKNGEESGFLGLSDQSFFITRFSEADTITRERNACVKILDIYVAACNH